MVQFTFPQTEIRNPDSGNTKVRNPGRTEEAFKPDKNGKSDFAETLKNEKISREKEREQETSGKKSQSVQDGPARKSGKNEVPQGKKTLRQHKPETSQEKKSIKGLVDFSEQAKAYPLSGSESPGEKTLSHTAGKQKSEGHRVSAVSAQSTAEAGKNLTVENAASAVSRGDGDKSSSSELPVSQAEQSLSGSEQNRPDQQTASAAPIPAETQSVAGTEAADPSQIKEGDPRGRKGPNHRDSDGKAVRSSLISVEDRRTVKTEDARAVFSPAGNGDSKELVLEMETGDDLTGTLQTGESRDASGRQFILHSAEEQKGSFLLNKQLQEGGTRDLAKNIRFVLKDNNHGEIKLILKPEALGKVRIHLNLDENNIVGKIIVENNSVKQVFQNNLADLSRALEDSGFDSAALDVSVGGGESGPQQGYREEQPVFFQREAADLEDAVPAVYEEGAGLSQIDLVI